MAAPREPIKNNPGYWKQDPDDLDAAYHANPERFVRGTPKPPPLPTAAWVNKPATEETAH